VLIATTAHRLAELDLRTEARVDLGSLREVYYPPVASIVLGFQRKDVHHPLDGFGMLIPEVEHFSILGCLFSSSLFPNRAPADHVTLTSYAGGVRDPDLANRDRDALVEVTLKDLRSILGVRGEPTFVHHCHFPHAIPQYEVGYGRFKNLMDQAERKAPGLFLAGHYRDGISLGDSIISGHNAAERIAEFAAASSAARIPAFKTAPAEAK
jgi:oxygen-dependent protoporphyrinogen oxidase